MQMRNQVKICMSNNQSFSGSRENFQNGDGLPLKEICIGQGSLEQQTGLQSGLDILILTVFALKRLRTWCLLGPRGWWSQQSQPGTEGL